MRSYKNKKGETIEVSKEHLDTAVRIKRELQMNSPSHRCSWSMHKKLMEKEGFYDSENSENYRLFVKNYQQSLGLFEDEVIESVSSDKLDAIKQATGEMYFTKKEIQLESRKLQKLKNELTLYGVVAEQVYNALTHGLTLEIPKWAYKDRQIEGKGRMIVVLSDWHIGSIVVDVNGNNYNYEIAQDRVKSFTEIIRHLAKINNIKDIDIVCLGDMTEHVSMRKVNQAFDVEFSLSMQIVKAFELIRDLIINLVEHFNVTYRGVSGNHDRMNGDKGDNIDGDSTVFVINYMIKTLSETYHLPRFEYHESDNINYSTTLEVNGIKMKFVHGDNEKGGRILQSHSASDNIIYNVVAMGHFHHFNVKEVGINQFEVYFGSLKGADNYSKKGKFSSSASQGVIIVDELGELDFKRINLQKISKT